MATHISCTWFWWFPSRIIKGPQSSACYVLCSCNKEQVIEPPIVHVAEFVRRKQRITLQNMWLLTKGEQILPFEQGLYGSVTFSKSPSVLHKVNLLERAVHHIYFTIILGLPQNIEATQCGATLGSLVFVYLKVQLTLTWCIFLRESANTSWCITMCTPRKEKALMACKCLIQCWIANYTDGTDHSNKLLNSIYSQQVFITVAVLTYIQRPWTLTSPLQPWRPPKLVTKNKSPSE